MTKEQTHYKVELGFVYDSGNCGTWDTDYIDVIADNEEEAIEKAKTEIWENPPDNLIHLFLYNIYPENEE